MDDQQFREQHPNGTDETSEQSCEQMDSEEGDDIDDDDQSNLHIELHSGGSNAIAIAEAVSSDSQSLSIYRGEVPTLGMVFPSETQAYEYYNSYGKATGFSVRRSKMVMRKDKTVTRRVFCCSKEGFRCKHPRGDPMRPRPLTRTGCKARLGIHLQGGKYLVNEFVQEHNHPLARPSESHMLRSQRKSQDPQTFSIEDILSYLGEDGGVPPQDLNLVEGESSNHLHRWCYEILKKAQV